MNDKQADSFPVMGLLGGDSHQNDPRVITGINYGYGTNSVRFATILISFAETFTIFWAI
jgi:hypothetical protein